MKIIIVSPAYPWRGGIAHHTSLLALHLSKRHTVEVVTFSRQYPSFVFPGKSQYDVNGEPLTVPTHQWIDSINPYSWIVTAKRIHRKNPDLIIFAHSLPFFGPCYGTIIRLVKWKIRTRVLFLCHNIIPHERRIGDIVFTRFAFKRSDYFIVQSSVVEQELLQLFPKAEYRLSPHPVYEKFGAPILKEEARQRLGISAKKVILYFGYVRAYKGLMFLIEAMRAISDRVNDVMLLIVGEFYENETQFRTRVRELGLEPVVRFVPEYVPNNTVGLYFSSADVVVLPYLSASQSGIAQIAYHFDKPIIATNVGGLAEVVVEGKTGFVVSPGISEALANAVRKFYEGGYERAFIESVRIEKRKYTWENLVVTIEELIAQHG